MKRHLISPPHRSVPLEGNPLWFRDAIIYEARVRSFYDSNGDGIGDFAGLATKLDYLQDLGVTAIWLLPFYPSPQRDDGYDIADYTDIHPDCGTLADFDQLLNEAHRRGLRIITELVMNHTSDQHPWFQRARRAPKGSVERDFYVWSDTPDRYREARIIFKDFEPSNWAFDHVANAYFWHRFYAHQPDLNFENPAVHEALLNVVDFWFNKGVDGLRLDAVPYLFESEGTNCENLPATHAFIKKVRAHIDARFQDRMLLAEANQWPEDAAAYFGDGDECHMNFHFPIMPRMFMAIHMEDRFPILDILAQTPQIPDNCQWALFLRNHDELTLEMVTDEERDYMYRAYAHATEMRINLGIRRRLAPLVGNDRRKMELLHGLLFSLPGTPVLYYGDEIGMGDNVYLGDRNGVRTPMQWSADRNAGFSRANPQRLILPINIDPEYHYESINVEAQQNNPNSLLWWSKRLIALRKQFQAFGRGTMEILTAGQLPRAGVHAPVRGRDDPGRGQPVAVPAIRRAGPQQVEGDAPHRAVRAHGVPRHRRSALPADAGRARVPLVLDRGAAVGSRRRSDRGLHGADAVLQPAESLFRGDDRVVPGRRAAGLSRHAPLVRGPRLPGQRRPHRRRGGPGRRVHGGGPRRVRRARPGALRAAPGCRAAAAQPGRASRRKRWSRRCGCRAATPCWSTPSSIRPPRAASWRRSAATGAPSARRASCRPAPTAPSSCRRATPPTSAPPTPRPPSATATSIC